jgi:hypothetical protein
MMITKQRWSLYLDEMLAKSKIIDVNCEFSIPTNCYYQDRSPSDLTHSVEANFEVLIEIILRVHHSEKLLLSGNRMVGNSQPTQSL